MRPTIEMYDDYDRQGRSCYRRAIRFGVDRWRVELGLPWLYVRLGGVEFHLGAAWAE